jgi:hypothetical protein
LIQPGAGIGNGLRISRLKVISSKKRPYDQATETVNRNREARSNRRPAARLQLFLEAVRLPKEIPLLTGKQRL